jgi:hypothetical protein
VAYSYDKDRNVLREAGLWYRAEYRYNGINRMAMSYSSGGGSRSMYLGTDVPGSVRSATVDTGLVEDRYEYDAFGTPYQGDFSGGMNLGYTGKPNYQNNKDNPNDDYPDWRK